MNENDKKYLKELKAKTAEELRGLVGAFDTEYKAVLKDTDARLFEYVIGVATDESRHNLYEMLAVLRFLRFAKRYEWRARDVQKFFKFYETLRFSGVNGRQRYKLTPVQAFQMANIFGWHDTEGRRLTQTAYIFVPRKYGKTTLAAALAVYDMLFGDNNAQSYVGANSYSQAKICFDEIRAIMFDIDPLQRHFRINREKITFKDGRRDSFIRCLTANAKTQDGLFASLVIMDEYAQARNTSARNGADLKNVLTTSMGPRKEPLTIIISTASDVVAGPFIHELEGVQKILRGEAENPRVFASLFMPDVEDKENSPRTWQKVQPHLGITVQKDFYEREYENAQTSAENMLAFRTKLLNVFTINEQKVWFSFEQAQALVKPFNIDEVTNVNYCAVAFDLSVKDDFSAVTYMYYKSSEKMFYAYTEYYFPKGALQGHPNEQLYRQWVAAGALKLCEGKIIDVRLIGEDIIRRSKKIGIIRIGYDSYKSRDLVNILLSAGAGGVLHPFAQTYGNFNLPVEALEMLAYKEPPGITINDNPINVFCLCNCVIDTDRLENKKPIKAGRNRKIDGAVTMLMALGMLSTYQR